MIEKPLPHDHGHIPAKLQAGMPETQHFVTVADMFKLLGDPTRLRIFWLLCHCEECVANIAALLELSSPAVSHHLKQLKRAGMVISRREGKEVCYTVARTLWSEGFHDMIEQGLEMVCPMEVRFEESREYDSQVQAVEEVHRLLSEDLKTKYTIEELAARAHMNQTTLKSTFKRVYGQPMGVHRREHRMEKAKELLCAGELAVAEIAKAVGYESQSKFTQVFKQATGLLPKDYRKQFRKG